MATWILLLHFKWIFMLLCRRTHSHTHFIYYVHAFYQLQQTFRCRYCAPLKDKISSSHYKLNSTWNELWVSEIREKKHEIEGGNWNLNGRIVYTVTTWSDSTIYGLTGSILSKFVSAVEATPSEILVLFICWVMKLTNPHRPTCTRDRQIFTIFIFLVIYGDEND